MDALDNTGMFDLAIATELERRTTRSQAYRKLYTERMWRDCHTNRINAPLPGDENVDFIHLSF